MYYIIFIIVPYDIKKPALIAGFFISDFFVIFFVPSGNHLP